MAEMDYGKKQGEHCTELAEAVVRQWPCPKANFTNLHARGFLDVAKASQLIEPDWTELFESLELSRHIIQVQEVLNNHRSETEYSLPSSPVVESPFLQKRDSHRHFPTLRDALIATTKRTTHSGPKSGKCLKPNTALTLSSPTLNDSNSRGYDQHSTHASSSPSTSLTHVSPEILELQGIVDCFAQSSSTVRQQYGLDLQQSLHAFRTLKNDVKSNQDCLVVTRLPAELSKASLEKEDHFQFISQRITDNCTTSFWLREGGLWPAITPVTLLENLRSTTDFLLDGDLKGMLMDYAISITALQRLKRMEYAFQRRYMQKYTEEGDNIGHINWSPLDRPDWILLEIDSNILFRPDQIDVANATISPASGANSVLQMNMGQGLLSLSTGVRKLIFRFRQNILYYAHGSGNSCRPGEFAKSRGSETLVDADRPVIAPKTWRPLRTQVVPCSILTTDIDKRADYRSLL